MSLKQFAEALPDYAKDVRLNLGSILSDQLMPQERKLGLLLACAHGSGHKPLVEAAEAEVEGKLAEEAANAARGAAAVMAMNNVYYRFVHLVANPEYGRMPARLRMNIIGSHGIAKEEFELMSLAVSAMNGCGMCIESHERTLLEQGVKPDVIQSAVRIAAVMTALATVHATL
jgi:alkyl hydroperoxide reductase subunit D